MVSAISGLEVSAYALHAFLTFLNEFGTLSAELTRSGGSGSLFFTTHPTI